MNDTTSTRYEDDRYKVDAVSARLNRTVLHELCRKGMMEQVSRLLEKNPDFPLPDVNTPDMDGNTPMHLAAGNGFSRICEMLIRHGARDDLKSAAKLTPSGCAERYGHPQTAQAIIEATSLRNSSRIKAIRNTRKRSRAGFGL